MRTRIASLIVAAGSALALGACAYPGLSIGSGYGSPYGYGGYGSGYGNPYSGYGDPYYGYGLGYGYGYSPYGRYGSAYGPYGGYGSAYGPYGGYGAYPGYYGGYGYSPYYGWYDGYYYPGTGNYVYDRDRKPHTISGALQKYWGARRVEATKSGVTAAAPTTPNFSGFTRPTRTPTTRVRGSEVNRQLMEQRRAERQSAVEQRRSDRESTRSERLSTRSERSTSTRSSSDDRQSRRRRD